MTTLSALVSEAFSKVSSAWMIWSSLKWWVTSWPTSTRVDCTVLSSIGFEKVSIRPVVIVTLCYHNRSRCRSTLTPCTPALAALLPTFTLPFNTSHSNPVGRMTLGITKASSSAAAGIGYRLVSAWGTRMYLAWVPSMRFPKMQPQVVQCECRPLFEKSFFELVEAASISFRGCRSGSMVRSSWFRVCAVAHGQCAKGQGKVLAHTGAWRRLGSEWSDLLKVSLPVNGLQTRFVIANVRESKDSSQRERVL